MKGTIFKHEQTDGSENWFLHLFARLFNIPCKGRVDELDHNGGGTLYRCTHPRWHRCKHNDAKFQVRWTYGDERYD
jgi:hypothetical protein